MCRKMLSGPIKSKEAKENKDFSYKWACHFMGFPCGFCPKLKQGQPVVGMLDPIAPSVLPPSSPPWLYCVDTFYCP